MTIATIGVDLAKNVFQVHGVDDHGKVVVRRALRRREMLSFFGGLAPCLVGMEACATAHHWARELARFGHEVRLMPPAYVKPYVKRNKSDTADAEAICEAVRRPTMRFVAVKSIKQQAVLMLHRGQALLVRQRTMLVNAVRAHLAEFGIVTGLGVSNVVTAARDLLRPDNAGVPEGGAIPDLVLIALAPLMTAMEDLAVRIKRLELEIDGQARAAGLDHRQHIHVDEPGLAGDVCLALD